MVDFPNGIGDGRFVRYGGPSNVDALDPVIYGGNIVQSFDAPGGVISPDARMVLISGVVDSALALPALASVPIGKQILIVPNSAAIPLPVLSITCPDGAVIAGSFSSLLMPMFVSDPIVLTSTGLAWTPDRPITTGAAGNIGALVTPTFQQDSEHSPGGTALAIPTAGVFVPWISGGGAVLSEPFITENAPGDYTINNIGGGLYELTAESSLNAPIAAVPEMAILFDTVASASAFRATSVDAATPVRQLSISGRTFLAGGTDINLAFTSDTNADVLSLIDVTLTIARFG